MPFRSSSGYNSGGTISGSLVFTKPAGTVSGDRLLCHIWERGDSGNVSPPSGWSLVRKSSVVLGGDNGFSFYTFTKVAVGSEPSSYTFTSTKVNHNSGVMTAYSGVSAIGVETGTTGTASGNNVTASSVAGTGGEILVAAWGVDGGSANAVTWTPPGDMAERADSGYVSGVSAADLALVSTGATGTKTATYAGGFAGSRCAAHTLTLVTNTAPNAPTLDSPVGGASIDLAASNRLSWTFSDPDSGDTQSKFDLRYRPAAGGAWTDVTGTTPNNFYDLAAATLTAGNYEWQVRTYDALGVVGPYSSSGFFTAATVSNDITITAPTNGATISTETFTVTWSTPTQTHYQLRVVADLAGAPDLATVIYDTGEIASSSARSRQVSYPDNGVTRHTQVRKKQDGLWSDWASVSNPVSFTTPAQPSIVVDDTSQPGAIQAQATHPTPTGSEPTVSYMDVWRRRAKVDANGTFVEWYDTERDPGGENGFPHRDGFEIAPTAIFTDWFVNGSGYSYRVRDVGSNGTSSYSEWSDDGSGEVVNEIDGGAPDTVYDDELDGGGP